MTQHQSARFSLLDQQIVDADGLPVGRIDDLWIELDGAGRLVITDLLVGAQALGERLGDVLGQLMAAAAMRFRSGNSPTQSTRIPARLISQDEDLIRLSFSLRDLPQVAGLERWLSRNLVQRFPGAGDADQ